MVDALTRIHAALVPGGVLVDTQPVSPRLPVALDGEPIGALDDDVWLEAVAAVDRETDRVLAAGLFEFRHEERYTVVHEFGSGDECLEVVGSWAGTTVPPEVASRLGAVPEESRSSKALGSACSHAASCATDLRSVKTEMR